MGVASTAPSIELDAPAPGHEGHGGARLRLRGRWTLQYATTVGDILRDAPSQRARGRRPPGRTARFGRRAATAAVRAPPRAGLRGASNSAADHHALVAAIEDVADERPKKKREYGFAAALGRLGFAVADNSKEIVALVSFLGENMAKSLRTIREPRRFRLTATVYHMEQVGLDAVPLVALLSLPRRRGDRVPRRHHPAPTSARRSYVSNWSSIAFLREFGVLLTAIMLAGRTGSAFTAQIGAMKSARGNRCDPHARPGPGRRCWCCRALLALLVMLPLLTFIAMVAGMLGGASVGAFSLDIPPQACSWRACSDDGAAPLPRRHVQGAGVRVDHRPDRLPGRLAGRRAPRSRSASARPPASCSPFRW